MGVWSPTTSREHPDTTLHIRNMCYWKQLRDGEKETDRMRSKLANNPAEFYKEVYAKMEPFQSGTGNYQRCQVQDTDYCFRYAQRYDRAMGRNYQMFMKLRPDVGGFYGVRMPWEHVFRK